MSTSPRHSEQTGNRPGPQISEACRQTVETARQSWIRKLIDLPRRNNLLYFRPLKTGTLELTSASSERLRDLLIGESVLAAKLLPNLEDDLLAKILRDISRRALENSEEKGLSTLFVIFGMATWTALDGDRPAEAPVLLLPVAISKKEGSNSFYLSAAGSFQLNLVLLHVLEDQFKVTLQPEELLAEFDREEEEGPVLDIKGLRGKIQRLMADAKGCHFREQDLRRGFSNIGAHARRFWPHVMSPSGSSRGGRSRQRERAFPCPLRRVFSQAADVLTAVCPCWMASPLSVSRMTRPQMLCH